MIPIENIYYMLSYAWGHVQEANTLDLSGIDRDTPEDLFGLVLARAAMQMLRQGLDQDYVTRQQDLRGVRGRVAIDETAKRALRPRGQISCVFDERTHDVLQNRIVYSTLKAIASTQGISSDVMDEVRLATSRFPRVSPIRSSARDFHSIQIHRNNRFYRFVLNICQLIHQNLLMQGASPGTYRFYDFRRDEARMGKLFESFVRSFLEQALPETSVSAPALRWAVQANELDLKFLPHMYSDIVLRRASRVLIVDTKFYADPIRSYRGAERIVSGNLYQILSYVTNSAVTLGGADEIGGMLLYAETDRDLSFDYRILGYPIYIRSVNLNQKWRDVHAELLTTVATVLDGFPATRGHQAILVGQ